jgi:hypothetical protein
MRVFEILIAESAISKGGGPFVPDGRLTYWIPDEAQELLEPILGPYDQNPMWYFDKLNFGRPPAPWALACLDREYPIAGHVATSRPPSAGISFAPYNQAYIPHISERINRELPAGLGSGSVVAGLLGVNEALGFDLPVA